MKFSWSLLAFVFLPAFTVAVLEINDTTIYKPCIQDTTECPAEQECFQYFCYPKQGATDPLKSCTKNSQCEGWTSRKDHTEKCYKNGKGVCVPKEDNEMCEAHVDCKGRGDKCCNDYCCNVEYFDALLKIACPEGDGHEDCEGVKKTMQDIENTFLKESLVCTTDALCEAKKNGHMCCEDNSLLKDIVLSDPMENWDGKKRCCMSATKLRKLSDVDEKLTGGDYDKIGQEIGKLAPAKQVEKCEELETSIAEKIPTCKTLLDEKKSKLDAQQKEEQAVEAAKAAASEVETAFENAEIQVKAAENASIAAETAKTTAETSKDLDQIKAANATAHAEAKKAQTAADKAAEEVITAQTALDTTTTEAAKAGSKKAEADKVVAAATKSAQNTADSATKAEEHAKTANAAAAAAKTAAKTAVDNPVKDVNKTNEIVSPPNTANTIDNTTAKPNNITTLQPVVTELNEVSEESNPEIPASVKTPLKENNSGNPPKENNSGNPPKEINSGNAVTMSTIGFISCLIFYSLINQLEVPASLF